MPILAQMGVNYVSSSGDCLGLDDWHDHSAGRSVPIRSQHLGRSSGSGKGICADPLSPSYRFVARRLCSTVLTGYLAARYL